VRLYVLLLVSFVEAMNIFITYPVMPKLLSDIGHMSLNSAAVTAGWMLTAYAMAQLLLSPLCGMLSDAFGRRPVMLLSFLAYAVDYGCMSIANTVPWLFLGRIVSGGVGATSVVANAYLADITTEAERAGRFGLLGSAFGCGFIVGPALGGLLAPLGTRAPFIAAALLAACTGLLSFFVLPETLPRERRKPIALGEMHFFTAVVAAFRRAQLRPLLVAVFVFELGFSVYPSLWSFYLIQRFQWSSTIIGLSLGLTGVMVMLGQGLVLGPLVKRIGERNTLMLGVGATVVALCGYAFANAPWMIFAITPLDLLCFMITPALNALISTQSGSDEQGYVQGVVSSVRGLTLVIGPTICTQIFAWSTRSLHVWFASGIAFLVAACCIASGLFFVPKPNMGIEPDKRAA
jgi:DHA1 family tetracycline resistance protein-like MFS transporter